MEIPGSTEFVSRFASELSLCSHTQHLLIIGARIADIIDSKVRLNVQLIGGSKRIRDIHSHRMVGTHVAITHSKDGVKRCRVRKFNGSMELALYLARTFGYTNVRLAYFVPGENNNTPFFFQTYSKGTVYND